MESIDKLREWIGTVAWLDDDKVSNRGKLTAIADAIEAEVADRYVPLPVDADGEPIRVGDMVRMKLLFGGMSRPLVVDRMELSRGKDGDLWCVALDTDEACWNQPSLLHHYIPPIVEDVLREFAEEYAHDENGVESWLIEKYAAKLRLAGEGE